MIISDNPKKHRMIATDTKPRLVDCFSAVFLSLSQEDITKATQASMPAWDSLATVTLVNVVEDEFGIEIPPDEVENLVSFETFLTYLS